MKNNIFILALTSIICLLPVILGLAVYSDLPDQAAMQWDLEGNPIWYAPKAIAVFGLPLLFAVLNIVVITILFNDPKRSNVSKKLLTILQWFIPVVSLVTVPLILFSAMGVKLPITLIGFILLGVMSILIGNYLPKSKQSFFVGIRLPWTLNDSENWNKTHRIAGYLWTIGGIIFIISGFISMENHLWLIVILSTLVVLIIAPVFYSYSLYKRSKTQKNN